MKLFIAIKFNQEIKNYINNIIHLLENCSNKGVFTRINNLHATILFLGETQRNKVAQIVSIMDEIEKAEFYLSLKGLGKFITKKKGIIYWLGVQKETTLDDIRNELYDKLNKLGYPLQNKRFKPHITLARNVEIDNKEAFNKLVNYCNKNKKTILVNSISLFKSERIENELIYTEIYVKQLKKQ